MNQLTPINSYDEIETETQWVTDNVRNGLTAVSLFGFAIAIFCWSLFPFLFPDTKKTEHRVINTSLFALVMLAGAGCVAAGVVVSHDEPIYFMKQQKRRTLTAYQFGVSEEIQKDQIMAAVLPQIPALPPTHEPITQPQLKEEEPDTVKIQPREVVAQNAPTVIQEVTQESDTKNLNNRAIDKIVYDLAACRNSILLCSKPGTGKTTLTLAWVWSVMNRSPETQFFIIGQKRDRWLGLGTVPGVLTVVEKDITELLDKVDGVCETLRQRCQTPEGQRDFEAKPIRLLFDDYTATYAAIKGSGKKNLDNFVGNIAYLVTVGREFNVCLYISAHSFNLSQLGLEGADIRDCLTLMCLGFESQTELGKSGGFESIATIFNNHYIVKKETKEKLINEYQKLKKLSTTQSKQLLFCTLGGTSLKLLSDLRWVKDESLVNSSKEINLKKPELPQIKSDNPGGEIGNIDSWLRVPFPEKLNLLPAHRPGLYALIIDSEIIYIGQSSNLYRRLNIDDHAKIPAMHAAKEKGLKTEVAYFSTNLSKEDRSKWEEKLYRQYDCDWNGRSHNTIPESINEKLDRQDDAIYQFCLQFNEPVKARDVQRNNQLKQEFNLDSEKVKKSFERLQLMKLGVVSIERVGGSDSWRFTPKI